MHKNWIIQCKFVSVTSSTTLPKATTQAVATTSVLGTMSLILTSTTLEVTFDGTTIVDLGTTKMKLISKMTGFTFGQTMTSIGTSTFGLTSILGTVRFAQEICGFVTNLEMVTRCVISAIILTTILNKSPFGREMKRMMAKRKGKTSGAAEI